MRYAVVILDGASGWHREEWGGCTSLQYAHTPNLDALAKRGIVGLAETVPSGLEPSSSAACMSIFGYHPGENYVGRGAIEGAALGIELAPDQIALRMNLCTTDKQGNLVSYSSGGISDEDAYRLVDEIKAVLDDETFRLVKGVSFRHILVVTGHNELLDAVYNAPHNFTGKSVASNKPVGPGTDILLEYMDRASAILQASEVNRRREEAGLLVANTAWAFWPGAAPASITPFEQKYGCRAALSSGVDLLRGIAFLTDVDAIEILGVTDGYDNDYAAQAEGCLKLFEDYDVVICHVEAPDTAGHEGKPEEKIRAIEAIDREIISRFIEWGDSHDLRILAMPDHPTPLETKTHSEQPVPFVLAGPGLPTNNMSTFDEDAARNSGLTIDPGCKMMQKLLSKSEKLE